MKNLKLSLLSILLLLGMTGVSFAISIPEVDDAKNGPQVVLIGVYNNSGSTMDVGDVAIWQVASSTGDNDNYVTTTTTSDTYLVAGVVYPADIAAGDIGTIAVRGPVQVDVIAGNLQTDAGLACSSGTAGAARSCTTDAANFGIVTQANTGTSAIVYVNTM